MSIQLTPGHRTIQFSDEQNPSTRSDARLRPGQLILFSLDEVEHAQALASSQGCDSDRARVEQ